MLVVDRKPLFRDSLAALLRSRIAGLETLAVATLPDGAPLMGQAPHGLLILEAEHGGGEQLLAAVRLIYPGWRIMLLGGSPGSAATPHIHRHLDADSDSETVIAEVRQLVETPADRPAGAVGAYGGWPAGPTAAEATGWRAAASPPPPSGARPARPLTRRQQDVLSLLAQGRSTKDMARALDLGIGTIKAHLDGIYRTLGVHSRIAAVARVQEFSRRTPSGPAYSSPDAFGSSLGGTTALVPHSTNVIRLDTRAAPRAPADLDEAPQARPAAARR
ncbi:MAG: response regulator transcription factor [Acetobacteraceae bacterium]